MSLVPGQRLFVNPCLSAGHGRCNWFCSYQEALDVAQGGDTIVLTPTREYVYPMLSLKQNVNVDGQGAWASGLGPRFPGTPCDARIGVTLKDLFFETPVNDGCDSQVASLVVDTYCGVKFVDCTFYVRMMGQNDQSRSGHQKKNGNPIKALGLVESNVLFFNCLFFFRVIDIPRVVLFDSCGVYGRQTWQNVRIRVDHVGVQRMSLFRRKDGKLDCSQPESNLTLMGLNVLVVRTQRTLTDRSNLSFDAPPPRHCPDDRDPESPLCLLLARLDLSGGGSVALSDLQLSLRGGGSGHLKLFDVERRQMCHYSVLSQNLLIQNTDHQPSCNSWTIELGTHPVEQPEVQISGLLTNLIPLSSGPCANSQ